MDRMRGFFADLSIFVKCLLLTIGAALVVAAIMSALNFRMVNQVIDDGVRALAVETTASVAAANGAALRFGNADAVAEALGNVVDATDAAAHALALDARGSRVAQTEDVPDQIAVALAGLAADALAEGLRQVSADGMLVAVPSFVGAGREDAVGAIAVAWSAESGRAASVPRKLLNLVLAGLALAVLAAAAAYLVRSLVAQPVSILAEEIENLRAGAYANDIPFVERGDEVGMIAKNLSDLQSQLAEAARTAQDKAKGETDQRLVVEALTVGLQTVANGDLTKRIETEFAPEYETLRSNFNDTVDTIVRVIQQMAQNSETIRSSAESIARSSVELSSRTENQAASLEETAAALDMITGNVEQSAKSAKDVERVVVDAKARALQSSSVVEKTVEAMARIEEGSRQISRISTVIDEIAFQTNLLALNAGVEAARAGDAGRGFSVVANEVRALAQRSSEAANEIKTLIGQSSDFVARGVELVGKAGTELSEITERVSTISGHIEGISKAASEQSSSLGEVNSGVAQLDRVTQQNAAMVSDATEASQTLKSEALAMSDSISVFKLPGRGASGAELSPRMAG